jgi:hypothetical protein
MNILISPHNKREHRSFIQKLLLFITYVGKHKTAHHLRHNLEYDYEFFIGDGMK